MEEVKDERKLQRQQKEKQLFKRKLPKAIN